MAVHKLQYIHKLLYMQARVDMAFVFPYNELSIFHFCLYAVISVVSYKFNTDHLKTF